MPRARNSAPEIGGGASQSFTVTFELRGGIGNIPPLTVPKGKTVAKPENPTKTGFTFGLWYTDKEHLTPFFFTTKITKNIALYARWNNLDNFTVRFNTNGGFAINDQIIAKDANATKPPAPTKPDAAFINWYKDSALTTPFNFDTTKIIENTILYTGWGYTVAFALDGGTGNNGTKPQTVLKGKVATKPPAPTKPDFAFSEWYKDETLTSPFFFATEKITKNITLYARWNNPDYFTVRFNTNGGFAINDQIIAKDAKATKPPAPTKPDAAFINWYKDSALTTPFNFATIKITANTILYAGWGVAVMFNPNGGSAITNQAIKKGAKATKPDTPTKEGVTFGGWYTDSALKEAFDFDTPITENIILYAGWGAIWSMVNGSNYNTVGIKKDGTLWAWGRNGGGQLGLGDKIDRHVPTQVGTATNWSMIAAGTWHTLGIKTDGTLWVWGVNSRGYQPIQVGDATWKAVAAGLRHTVGIQTNSTLWAWGWNAFGQLGLKYTDSRITPTLVKEYPTTTRR